MLFQLKKFKKEKNSHHQDAPTTSSEINNLKHVDTSTPHYESTFTSGRSTPASSYSPQSNNQNNNNQNSQKSPFPYTSLTETSKFNNQSDYLKDQLQLHVQTIGINKFK